MISLTEARDAYRGYAPAYDLLFGPLLQTARRRAIRVANDRPGQRVLEIGVGTGLSLPHYRPDVQLVGIDVSDEMLAKARDRARCGVLAERSRFHLMNAEAMDFLDGSFDVVVALFVASTVQDLARFGAEIRRVCRPDGRIVLVNHFSTPGGFSARLSRHLGRFAGSLGFEPYFPLDHFLDETGLRVAAIEPTGVFGRLKLLQATNG
ncbi:MAG TPA: methyltransferase domain-containing protein [Aliidongia sp.]|uniref:class I SAM-dependent methyltransferase n=1 Tax=Aliidongia sp. TaxID=1914230 RepID=UPI002DDD1BD4|nr:methyltransferase domain-containing protein [Aliidongia sp.]HEV2675510.1 methyltransferase domain-containing protein [Aliidongia sp.]